MAKESEARIRFSVFNEDYKRGIKEINDENRRMKNEFKLTEAQMKNNSSETEKLETRIERLGREKENVRRKVQLTEQQLEKAKEVYGENSTEAQTLSDDLVKLQTSEQRLQNAIDDANVQLTNQREEMARAEAEQYAKNIEDAGKAVEDLGRKMQDQGKKMSAFGKAWSMRVTAPILGAAAASLKVGMDFEEGMSQVQALTGATGRDLEMLSDQAKEMGSTTRFSATEAADAMGFLGMAGWETNEIMSGLPGVLDLAAAGKLELGRAADITSNIMSAFNMEAEHAGEVSDLLAYAASNANTNVEQMGEAMKYLAPVANTLGMSIEDATAAVMANSDAGIQGSMAGRTFATSLQRLANPTAAMQKEMEKLNIEFFNSEGQLKELPELVRELEEATVDMDDKTKAATLSTLFGTEAQKNWSILLEEGSEALSENSKALSESEGAAKDMADTMQDNAKGALTEFRSAAEGLGIAFAEHMLPAFTRAIEAVTDLTRRFGELDDETQEQIIKWGLLLAAVGPVVTIFGKVVTVSGTMITKVGGLIKLFGTAKGTGLIAKFATMGAAAGPVGLAVGTIGALGVGIYALTRETRENITETEKGIQKRFEEVQALDDTINAYDELQRKNKLTRDEMLRYLDITEELANAKSEETIEKLKDEQEKLLKASGLTNIEMETFIKLNDDLVERNEGVVEAISEQGNAYIGVADELREVSNLERQRAIDQTYNEITEQMDQHIRNLQEQIKHENKLKDLEEDKRHATEDYIQATERSREINSQINELREKQVDLSKEEQLEIGRKILDLEQELLLANNMVDISDKRIEKAEESIEKEQGKLDKVNEQIDSYNNMLDQYESLLLYQQGIVDEKGNAYKSIEDANRALDDQRKKLLDQLNTNKITTDEYNEQIDKIRGQEKAIIGVQGEADELNKSLSQRVDKDVLIQTNQSLSSFEQSWSRSITKRINIDGRVNGPAAISAYSSGTNYHKGGPALVGEEGPELAKYRNKYELLTFGVRNLERGTKVYTAKQTEQIFKSGKVPSYADGIGNTSLPTNIGESLARNQESIVNNQIVVVVQPSDVNLDNRQVGSMQWKVVKEFIDRDTDTINQFRG